MSTLHEDESINFGIDEVGNNRRSMLSDMLDKTTYDERQKEYMRYAIDRIEWMHQFDFIIKRIEMNSVQDEDRISMGFNYNQSDIKKRVKKYGGNR